MNLARRVSVRFAAYVSRPAIALVVLTAAASASAQPSLPQTQATAEALFEEARKLMSQGKFAEACPKLAESQRLDPGGGTVLNLALCHEAEGRTATAWAEFKEAVAWAIKDGRSNREKLAREHIAALEPKLVRLVITPKDAVKDLEVRLDGVVVGQGAWGVATPVDPGDHQIEATAPHFEKWSGSVTITAEADSERIKSDKTELVIPPLTPLPPELDNASDRFAVDGAPAAISTQRRIVTYASLGIGIAGVSAGAVFSIMALAKRSDSNNSCPNGDASCSAEGVRLNKLAITYSWISTASFGVGIAGSAVATYLLLTSGKKTPKTVVVPHVGLGGGGLSFERAF